MKTFIYVTLAILLVLSSIVVVAVYMTQDFSEDIKFVSTVKYGDIKTETGAQNSPWDNQTYLISAEIEIGKIVLENKGYFTQVYEWPEIIGCINSNENGDVVGQNKFGVTYLLNGIKYQSRYSYNYQYGYDYDNTKNMLSVPVGEKEEVTLIARYPYDNYAQVPLSEFSRDKVKTVSLYRLTPENVNPLEGVDSYNANKVTQSSDCNTIEKAMKPVAVVMIA